MGKKGSWFSAIKRVFTHDSNEKLINVSDKKNRKEKKKGKGILGHSDTKSFIPLFREPSSIEKILGEADQLLIKPLTFLERPNSPKAVEENASSPKAVSPRTSPPKLRSPKPDSPKAAPLRINSPRGTTPKAAPLKIDTPRDNALSPKVVSPKAAPHRGTTPGASSSKAAAPIVNKSRKEISYLKRPEPTLRNQNLLATKIQTAYRGYVARRSFRTLRGLVRLQSVVRGQNVRRQTANAMKQMQLLVRVQTQIQSRRIQMLESRAQAYRSDKEVESTLSKWTQLANAANNEYWDDSSLTKEEVEARSRKKIEAVVKRERAMAYAYSNQLWKNNTSSVQSYPDIRSNGYPWWWNWLERQVPPTTTPQTQNPTRNVPITPPRPISEYKPSPRVHSTNYKQKNFAFDNQESPTPRSSSVYNRAKPFQTPIRTPSRTPPPGSGNNYSRPRASASTSVYDASLKDDDSLMSCPPFSVPNYMSPTVSAKAKARANSNPKERFMGTPTPSNNDSKRRFSFPWTPNIGPSSKWNKGGNKDSVSQKGSERHRSSNSIGDVSVDSAISMPVIGGRKPFNRFV